MRYSLSLLSELNLLYQSRGSEQNARPKQQQQQRIFAPSTQQSVERKEAADLVAILLEFEGGRWTQAERTTKQQSLNAAEFRSYRKLFSKRQKVRDSFAIPGATHQAAERHVLIEMKCQATGRTD